MNAPTDRVLRTALHTVLWAFAEENTPIQDSEVEVTEFVGPRRITARMSLKLVGDPLPPAEDPAAASPPGRPLSEVELAAMRAATETPVSLKSLARLAGYIVNSYFRQAITKLV